MFFRAVTTPLMTPVPNFNKWCAVSNFLFKNIDFCIFTPKTPIVQENYFLTLWNFTYLKDTSFGKKSCNFEYGLETKNEFEKGPLITFFQCRSRSFNITPWTSGFMSEIHQGQRPKSVRISPCNVYRIMPHF